MFFGFLFFFVLFCFFFLSWWGFLTDFFSIYQTYLILMSALLALLTSLKVRPETSAQNCSESANICLCWFCAKYSEKTMTDRWQIPFKIHVGVHVNFMHYSSTFPAFISPLYSFIHSWNYCFVSYVRSFALLFFCLTQNIGLLITISLLEHWKDGAIYISTKNSKKRQKLTYESYCSSKNAPPQPSL